MGLAPMPWGQQRHWHWHQPDWRPEQVMGRLLPVPASCLVSRGCLGRLLLPDWTREKMVWRLLLPAPPVCQASCRYDGESNHSPQWLTTLKSL